MSPLENLMKYFPDAVSLGNKWQACCPVKAEHGQSLTFYQSDDGQCRIECEAGCSSEMVFDALGIAQGESLELHNPADIRVSTIDDLTEKNALLQTADSTKSNKTPVAESQLNYRPFPVEVLPEPLKSFVVEGARAIGCDPSFVALPLLTALGAAIGNSRHLQLKRGWTVPPILWMAVVGDSGTSKTPAFKLAMKAIRKRQEEALERHKVSIDDYDVELAIHEKKLAEWKRDNKTLLPPPEKPDAPEGNRYVIGDTTVEALTALLRDNPRGLLLARDELSGWIASFDRYTASGGSADAAHWLSMFNGESLTVDRKTGDCRTIHVPHAYVSVCGGIQPEILKRVIGSQHRESGLLARILLAFPPRRVKRWTESDIDPAKDAKISSLFDRLYDLEPQVSEDDGLQPVIITLTPAAKSEWIDFYNSHASEQSQLEGEHSAAWSKLEEYAARLALVIHLCRVAANDVDSRSHDTLDELSMRSGIQLIDWFKHETRRVYDILSDTEEEREDRQLIHWISRRGEPVTSRDVQSGCRWLRQSGKAENALNRLVKYGKGFWKDSSRERPGHPTRYFHLNHNAQPDAPTSFTDESCNHEKDVRSEIQSDCDQEWGAI